MVEFKQLPDRETAWVVVVTKTGTPIGLPDKPNNEYRLFRTYSTANLIAELQTQRIPTATYRAEQREGDNIPKGEYEIYTEEEIEQLENELNN